MSNHLSCLLDVIHTRLKATGGHQSGAFSGAPGCTAQCTPLWWISLSLKLIFQCMVIWKCSGLVSISGPFVIPKRRPKFWTKHMSLASACQYLIFLKFAIPILYLKNAKRSGILCYSLFKYKDKHGYLHASIVS